MEKDFGSVRRKMGMVCLAVPAAMVVLGQTALKTSLDGVVFLGYWLVCFLFTSAAMFVALAEIRAVRRQTRQETEALIEKTFDDVQREKDERRKDFP